jgi:UDP-N-acetylmuramoyl-tripeptide--D-alanyl-D-alanine ligase
VAKAKKINCKNILGNEILILEIEKEPMRDLGFFLQKSKLPILVSTHVGEIPLDFVFFAGEKEDIKETLKIVKILPPQAKLVLNFDDETVREIADIANQKVLTFGFQKGADLQATDIKLNSGTNFKLNFKGSIIPVWLHSLFGKEQIYSALAAISVGILLDLNLIEISQAFKNYKSLPGKMRLIKGIKNSFILDDTASASVFSMMEALEILGKIEIEKLQPFKKVPENPRKIAVLGDILGIGKYTIEAHEAIGEKVKMAADLLFVVGQRAKFIAQGAIAKGMPKEKIFQFDKVEEAAISLQNEIKQGDLILVDGSKEMQMQKIIKEIKAF